MRHRPSPPLRRASLLSIDGVTTDCWVVEIEGQLAGLVICKNETHADAQTAYAAQRILKVCTFKMKQEYQGEKFGEQLLKKLLWFAQGNRYEAVYLTAYPKQETLIHLLQAFGFEITRTLEGGELFIEKALHPMNVPIELKGLQPLARDMQVYPRFYDGQDVTLAAGDLLLFYLSKSPDLARSQSVTTVGVVEHTQLATSFNDLTRMVGRRSVYAKESLEAWQPSDMAPVFVIDFLLSWHFNPHIPLAQLLEIGVFSGRPPMSIKRLTEQAYAELRASAQINYA